LETWSDAAIGETRQVVVRDGAPIALHVARWSDIGRRALWGETYFARIRTIDRRRRGAFLDIGVGEGFLRLDAQGRVNGETVSEGLAVTAHVVREGVRGKGPVLQITSRGGQGAPRRLGRHESDDDLDAANAATPEIRDRIDEVIETTLAPTVAIPGGGTLTIQPTAALVAIDVDAGARTGSSNPEHFARELNLAAATAAMRELRLRNLGGIVAIDFVSQRDRTAREAIAAALKAAAADDPWGVIVAPMSRFGVVELSRGQLRAPLHERMLEPDGRPTPETVALRALRAMEREARSARGRDVTARLAPEVADWLERGVIDWRSALHARIGPRWRIIAEAGAPRERVDVEAV
jgi:Ribonuclease G/E